MSASSIIRCLHLSDLHFDDAEGWERRAILQAMERCLAEQVKAGPIDLLLVTGDIANRGRRAEYDQAQQFLVRLATTLRIDLATRCFVVPGNHDVDRGRITRASALMLAGLEDEAAIGEVMVDSEAMRLLGARLSEFYAFTARLLGTARAWTPERPWRVDEIELGGVRLALLQLNSAWASGAHEDRGRLLVGEYQVRAALDECAQATLRLALLHHPIEDLREEDRDRVGGLLLAPGGADVVLRGHLHAIRSEHVASPDAACVHLAAGAAYTHDRWPKTFHIVELDLERAEVRIRSFRYSDRGPGFWAPDTGSYERARDGTWSHPLAALRRARSADVSAVSEASNRRTIARWREASAAVHGTQRFIGLADRSPKPNVRVEAVFVPLRIARIREAEWRGRSWQTSGLIPLLSDRLRRGPRRIVILGDPGSGKTTLCRYLAVALSGGLPHLHAVPDGTLPLLLPFRDYVAAIADAKSDVSIVEYLVRIAATHLAVRVTVEDLERQLDAGDSVLLLDGLDEVGEPEQRADMRDRVLAFCSRYPKVAVLATSRFAGYDDAPLPTSGAHAFRRFGLQSLSAPEIDAFVERWYLAQEPDDAVARRAGEVELKAALRAEPAALALARNPLLLTLIALVHRSEARLPGERVKLFEKCVDTMLETWPAVRKREFRGLTVTAQRACLEGVAWFLQHRRVDGGVSSSQLVLTHRQLREVACDVLVRRGFVADADPEAPRLVDAWIDYLARETGLLVELSPGRFGFLHLALMEYLAACQLDREIGDSFDEWRQVRHRSAWHEVWLLHVGRHAEDPRFLAELSGRSIKSEQWEFLLRCIREEACISGAVVDRVLDELFLAAAMPSEVLADVLRFSRRHADRAAAWLTRRLASDRAIELQRALRIAHEAGFPGARIVATLARRTDVDDAVLAILGAFWPIEASARESDFVGWAWRSLPSSTALQWACALVDRDVSAGALLAHAIGGSSIRAAFTARLTELALDVTRLGGARRARELDLGVVPGGHVVCATVRGISGAEHPRPRVRQRLGREQCLGGEAMVEFVRSIPDTMELVRGYAGGEWLGLAECPAWEFLGYFATAAPAEQVRALNPEFYDEWYGLQVPEAEHVSAEIDDESDEADEDFMPGNYSPEKFVVEDLEEAIRSQFAETPAVVCSIERPDAPPVGRFDLAMQVKRGDIAWVDALLQAMAIHTGVALVASCIAILESRYGIAELGELMSVRAWTLVNWDWLDDQLPVVPDPAQLALYLALGWTQCSSSGRWPDSSRWREILAGEPPAHWLPRVQWHLCWLTADPTAGEHRQGLDDALVHGVDDPELAPAAAFLRERLFES